jgi:hypothetical protein
VLRYHRIVVPDDHQKIDTDDKQLSKQTWKGKKKTFNAKKIEKKKKSEITTPKLKTSCSTQTKMQHQQIAIDRQ